MVNEFASSHNWRIVSALAAESFKRDAQGFEFGACPLRLLAVKRLSQQRDILPAPVADANLRNLPIALRILPKTERRFHRRLDRRRGAAHGDSCLFNFHCVRR